MGRLADRPAAKGRLKRRAFPIHAYVGPNGTGKSAVMVYDTLPSLDNGRPVLSTVRLLDYNDPHECGDRPWDVCDDPDGHRREKVAVDVRKLWTPEEFAALAENVDLSPDDVARLYALSPDVRTQLPTGVYEVHRASHRLYVKLTSYQQMLDWRNGDVLLDEILGIANSRESNGMPVPIQNLLVQLRRRNVSLRWSAPAWGRADKIIREVSQGVTLMSASMPKRAKQSDDGSPRMWSERRLFVARTYDPVNMDEFEAHRADTIPAEVTSFYWGPRSLMFAAYDTYDSVSSIGWADLAAGGACISCGGKRRPTPCSCDDHTPVRVPGARKGPAREVKTEERPGSDAGAKGAGESTGRARRTSRATPKAGT